MESSGILRLLPFRHSGIFMSRKLVVVLLLIGFFISPLQSADQFMEVSVLRRPIAIEHVSDFKRLVVLNQRSASLSVFDLTTRKVIHEAVSYTHLTLPTILLE